MSLLDADAERHARRALSIFQKKAPESYGAAAALNFLRSAAGYKGDPASEELFHRQALVILEKIDPASDRVARILSNLGAFATDGGDLAAAEDLNRRALAIREKLDPEGESVAASLVNLGALASERKDLDLAEAYYRRALAIWERLEPGNYGTAVALQNLAVVELDRDDLVQAETHFRKAIALYRKFESERDVALILMNLGLIAQRRRDFDSAAKLYQEALGTLERDTPESLESADALTDLGELESERGDFAAAEAFHRRALGIREGICPRSAKEATSLHSLGLIALRKGQRAEAAGLFQRAIEALEFQKQHLGGSEETRSRFGATYADFYRDYIEVLIGLGQLSEAFHVQERFLASSLLSMLAERHLLFETDIPADIERERILTNAAYERTQREIADLNPREDGKRIDELLGHLTEMRASQQQIADRMRKASPRYASLRYPQPLDLVGTRAVLESGTLLLSYSVGKDKAFALAVEPSGTTGSGLTLFTLSGNDRSLRDSVQAFLTLVEWEKPSSDLTARARSLYDTLLKPAEALIARYDRLLIIPDGPLHTLPWAALIRSPKNGRTQYFAEWRPSHTAVSATVYAELNRTRSKAPRDPSIIVTAFGEPNYPKLLKNRGAAKRGDEEGPVGEIAPDEFAEVEEPHIRSVARGGFRFEPLPESRKEVQEIASLYAPRSAAHLGADATEEKAKSIGKDVPIIHFATHAVINERFPLDSALVLSIPEHPKEGQDNGLLQAWEIFERMRIDADLVTLSACESGLGKEMGGEGLIGLTRAFQYAGARSVLASLWKVEDKATGELMKRFYTYLKAGKTKDEALRSAQIDLIHSSDYSHPRDWAAFQLNGDWK
jgi:CHAT domain-containing protein/Tfp pilus assembly protein PilF